MGKMNDDNANIFRTFKEDRNSLVLGQPGNECFHLTHALLLSK